MMADSPRRWGGRICFQNVYTFSGRIYRSEYRQSFDETFRVA